MHNSMVKKANRTVAGIISIMMLVVLLFSAFYPVVEAGHECTGHDCETCACIRQCAELLRHAGETLAFAVFFLLSCVVFHIALFSKPCLAFHKTPVEARVRLNN